MAVAQNSLTEQGVLTRERLLDVAEKLFAQQGYAATSVREITTESECNVAAVNYHFGGKLGLYQAVFARHLKDLRDLRLASIEKAIAGKTRKPSLEVVLTAFASSFLEPLMDTSRGLSLIELIGREMLDPQLPTDFFVSQIAGPVQKALVEAIVQTTPGLVAEDARLCVLSIVGQLIQAANRYRHQLAQPENVIPALPDMPKLIHHIVRFSAAGVRASCRGVKP